MALGTAADLRGAERRTLGKLLSVRFGSWGGVELVLWGEFGCPDGHDGRFFPVNDREIAVFGKQGMKWQKIGFLGMHRWTE